MSKNNETLLDVLADTRDRIGSIVDDLKRRLAARDNHATMTVRRITNREDARRVCFLVLHDLALPSSTTTEIALANYLLDLIGRDQED
jgi:hypothetical protein